MARVSTLDGTDLAPFRAQVRRWEDDEVFDAAAQMRALQDTAGWEVLARLLGVVDEEVTYNLRFMPVESHAAMARAIGYSAGMTVHKAALEAILEEADKREQLRQARVAAEEAEV